MPLAGKRPAAHWSGLGRRTVRNAMTLTQKQFRVDAKTGTVRLQAPKSIYSTDAIKIAAYIFSRSAEVMSNETGKNCALTLKAKKNMLVVDGKNALDGEALARAGISYYGIGRQYLPE